MARDASRRAASGRMDDQRERIVQAEEGGLKKGWQPCQAAERCPRAIYNGLLLIQKGQVQHAGAVPDRKYLLCVGVGATARL